MGHTSCYGRCDGWRRAGEVRLLFASLAHDRGLFRRLPTQNTARSDYGAAKVKPTTGRRTGTELKKRSGTAHASHPKSSNNENDFALRIEFPEPYSSQCSAD